MLGIWQSQCKQNCGLLGELIFGVPLLTASLLGHFLDLCVWPQSWLSRCVSICWLSVYLQELETCYWRWAYRREDCRLNRVKSGIKKGLDWWGFSEVDIPKSTFPSVPLRKSFSVESRKSNDDETAKTETIREPMWWGCLHWGEDVGGPISPLLRSYNQFFRNTHCNRIMDDLRSFSLGSWA